MLRGVLSFLSALLIASVPFSVDLGFSTDTPFEFAYPFGVYVKQNTCYAESLDEYNSFIEEMAEQAGMTPADYIAAVTGINNIATGVNFVKQGGLIGYAREGGATMASNLQSLVDAADYPDWTTLTNEQREDWGTRDAYEASKFNSLMDAFGLGSARDRYYTGSGGGNFEWQQDEIDKLQTIGRIGGNWARGAANTFGSVTGLISDKGALANWLGNQSCEYDATNDSVWPTGVQRVIPYYVGSVVSYTNSNTPSGRYFKTSSPVHFLITTHDSGYNVYSIRMLSKSPFTYNWKDGSEPTNLNTQCNTTTFSGYTFYYAEPGSSLGSNWSTSYPVVDGLPSLTRDQWNLIYTSILFGDVKMESNITDYPQQTINNNLNVYFPENGATRSDDWADYTTEPENPPSPQPSDERPTNDYNPDNQTGGSQWQDDTTANVIPLMGIQFDKLFPFCLLFDISTLFDKVEANFSGDGDAYNTIEVPFEWDDNSDEELELDLTWLHDLALIIRPFFQILLAVSLLFVTIWFWQSILTG